MRRLLFFLIAVLLATPALAEDQHFIYAKKKATGETCGDASGLLFEWHMENATVTTGTPAGCSSGDTTATVAGTLANTITPQDGSYALYKANATNGSAALTITSNDIAAHAEGTLIIYFRFATWASGDKIVLIDYGGTGNSINLATRTNAGNNALKAQYQGNGAAAVDVFANSTYMSADTWYKLTLKWKVGGTPTLSVQVDAGTPDTTNTALTAMTSDSGTLTIGSWLTSGLVAATDNIKIYNGWLP